MKIPVSWLREYVHFDETVEQLAHALTTAGLEVAHVNRTGEEWDGVYVGKVESVEPHPNADKLVLATVSYGAESLTVVTGAPNIEAGQKVALALAGAVLVDAYSEEPRWRKLKPSAIRGVRSEGMVCSERELGLSDEHEGILQLPQDAPVGSPLADYLGDQVLDLELTPNFAYAASVVGLAREVAAITGGTFREGSVPPLPDAPAGVEAMVQGAELASRYMLQRLDNVSVRPSSERIQRRLRASGLRTINNVVDVTNYVMLEYGQPLHAFDAARVRQPVLVRPAEADERFETLDHQTRELPCGTVMIADAEKAVGIGGIMGGLHSEVGPETTSILLEAATFNPVRLRRSAVALGLRTDASGRFEKGLDPELAATALARAVELLAEEAGADTVGGPYDWYPRPEAPAPVLFPLRDVRRLLGISIARDEVGRILRSLGFGVNASGEEALEVVPPTWRRDIARPADLVEEIGRIHGYDSVPSALPAGELPPQRRDREALIERKAREWLVGAGLQEIINYDLTNPQALEPLRSLHATGGGPRLWRPVEDLLKVRNPVSTEREYLRPSLLPILLQNARDNLRHGDRVALFELDRVFIARGGGLPSEPKRLALAMAGLRRPASPHVPESQVTLFDVKGVVDGLLHSLRIRDYKLTPFELGDAARGVLAVEAGGRCAGFMFGLSPAALHALDIEQDVWVAELDWDALLPLASLEARYRPFSRFPEVLQDLAVAVPEDVPAAAVIDIIQRYGGRTLHDASLVEVYRGTPLPQGIKSLLYRLSFQSFERTLTEADATKARRAIERALRQELGAQIRGVDTES